MTAVGKALRFARGLRFRLALSYVFFFTILLVMLGLVFRQTLSRTFEAEIANVLDEEWGAAKGYLRTGETGPDWFYDKNDPDEAFVVARATRVYMLADTQGHRLQNSVIYDSIGIDKPSEIQAILASGKPFQAEIQMCRKDGTTFWCRMSAKAVDAHRPAEGTIWIMEDVTTDRLMREALEQSTRELTAIFETAMAGIAVVRERRVVRCNRRFEELFGYGPGEMAGQSTRLWYLSDEDYQTTGATAYPDLARGNVHQRDQDFRRKDGSVFRGSRADGTCIVCWSTHFDACSQDTIDEMLKTQPKPR
jgi:PAS domain S-box-containing protein